MRGSWGQFTYSAKIFDSPSRFGINGGRISKLNVRDAGGREVANYDRGWDTRPEGSSPVWRLIQELEQS